jgi:DNA-binding XRE family transcriptional regulator
MRVLSVPADQHTHPMAKTPFRSCDYCGRNKKTRSPWSIHGDTRKLSCPRCHEIAREENAKAQRLLKEHRELLRLRLLAEPTPMYGFSLLTGYHRIKAQYPDAVLLYRVGDEYTAIDSDARHLHNVLGLQLTSWKPHGLDRASFPFHALEQYLPRLVRAGHRVAICDALAPESSAVGPPSSLGGRGQGMEAGEQGGEVSEPLAQYRRLKPQFKHSLLVLRDHLGYLMLYRDAERAAKVIGVQYPGNGPFRIAKCMLEPVLDQLVAQGFRIAVVIDPVIDDPRNARQSDLWDEIPSEETVVNEPAMPRNKLSPATESSTLGPPSSLGGRGQGMEAHHFPSNLRAMRQHLDMSQQQMADRLGVKRSSYSGWENGYSEPSLKDLQRIQHELQVGVDVLLNATLQGYRREDFHALRMGMGPRPRVTRIEKAA